MKSAGTRPYPFQKKQTTGGHENVVLILGMENIVIEFKNSIVTKILMLVTNRERIRNGEKARGDSPRMQPEQRETEA